MWRAVVLVSIILTGGILAWSDSGSGSPASKALVQIQECLELQAVRRDAVGTATGSQGQGVSGLSLRSLVATLGIGLLTVLCFVPAALLMELFIRRSDGPQQVSRILER